MPRHKRRRGEGGGAQWTPEEFFMRLPPDELTVHEQNLRQALVDFAGALPGPFPLTEWIERRIGGEFGLAMNDDDGYDIWLLPPPSIKPGDWTCPNCGVNVFGSKDVCFKCKEPKPRSSALPGPAIQLPSKDQKIRPGDWPCPNCGNNVFASKDTCPMCRTPKPQERLARRDEADKICKLFASTGSCKYGNDCKFMHDGELRAAPPRGTKRGICNLFKDTGTCKYGDDCKFLHVGENAEDSDDASQEMRAAPPPPPPPRGKKKGICHLFKDTGECKYGDDCKFRHDGEIVEDEESDVDAAPVKKKGICRLWRKAGECKYGDDCKFKHDEGNSEDEDDGRANKRKAEDVNVPMPSSNNNARIF